MILFVFFGGARRSERGSRRCKVTEVGMKERKRGAEGGRDIDKGQRTKEKCTVQNKTKQKIKIIFMNLYEMFALDFVL